MLSTAFAVPYRRSEEDLLRQIGYFSNSAFTYTLLNALPSVLLVLNDCRQIIFANSALKQLAGLAKDIDLTGLGLGEVFGQRPGEVLGCTRAEEGAGGCGTAEGCAQCGAVQAILDSIDGRPAVNECRLTVVRDGELQDLDLLVWTSPFEFNGERFTICAFSDISSQKRRNALERIFFHDILNLAGGIKGFAELLERQEIDNPREALTIISSGASKIVDEIRAQQMLVEAENRELQLSSEPIRVREFLETQHSLWQAQALADGKVLRLEPIVQEELLVSDAAILGRVVGNMLKNAIEAVSPGQKVTLSCHCHPEEVEFRVHNPGAIPLGVQFQIFHRSYSTKGESRGLGTYSMRLLSQYLKGRVGFTSNEREGTTFHAIYPRNVQ